MANIKAFVPPEIGDEEHIIRRLGWALVKGWPDLPEDIQRRLREQAVFVHDKFETPQLDQQISIFLRKHAGSK
jgi:hypothetical protein